jgi:hypothetical protein
VGLTIHPVLIIDKEVDNITNGSTALCWALVAFFKFLDPINSRLDSLDNKSSHRKVATYTQNNIDYRIDAHNTDIHAVSGIRTHDPSVLLSEDSSCLRPRGHCDWHSFSIAKEKLEQSVQTAALHHM